MIKRNGVCFVLLVLVVCLSNGTQVFAADPAVNVHYWKPEPYGKDNTTKVHDSDDIKYDVYVPNNGVDPTIEILEFMSAKKTEADDKVVVYMADNVNDFAIFETLIVYVPGRAGFEITTIESEALIINEMK